MRNLKKIINVLLVVLSLAFVGYAIEVGSEREAACESARMQQQASSLQMAEMAKVQAEDIAD